MKTKILGILVMTLLIATYIEFLPHFVMEEMKLLLDHPKMKLEMLLNLQDKEMFMNLI